MDEIENNWKEKIFPVFFSAGYAEGECDALARLIDIFLSRPQSPRPFELYPRYNALHAGLKNSLSIPDADIIEERLLQLYVYIHGYEAFYTSDERSRMDKVKGYWNHAGGISPLIKAGSWISEGQTSADFGAGNGLQGLLLHKLYPHQKTFLYEISSQAVENGKQLQNWLNIEPARVCWSVQDLSQVTPKGIDFAYLYRPLKPDGPGRNFYRRFAEVAASTPYPNVIFSIADCLRGFLPGGVFEIFYSDGHLTCFKRKFSVIP